MSARISTAAASRRAISSDPMLTVEDLRVQFHTDRGDFKAVDGVSFALNKGERFGLVGESGSGKSTTALAIMRMIKPPGQITSGRILLHRPEGAVDMATLSDEQMRQMRLSAVSMIPQGSMNSLNPVRRVRDHFEDSILAHNEKATKAEIAERMNELLEMVGLPVTASRLYPHELSGGMKQRVCIALAITLAPNVIIADEPTSALDVVVQRRVMETLGHVQDMIGASVLFVGHDMGLLAQFVDRVGVMYRGKLVEVDTIQNIFAAPQHPYTQMLISSLPTLTERGAFRKARAASDTIMPSGAASGAATT